MPEPPRPPCDHQFKHLSTVRWIDYQAGHSDKYVRLDTFFCEKCLKYEDKKREQYSRDTPDWFREDYYKGT